MLGLMMEEPLLIERALRHAARWHGETEIVSRRCEGDIHRASYAETYRRTAQLAHALTALGIQSGDRIGTLAWNGYRHIELYYGVAGVGAVCHTINPRLFDDQIIYIVNDAADRILFFDLNLLPLIERIADRLPRIETFVLMTDAARAPASGLRDLALYEDLLADRPETYDWPSFDERTASGLCYTSGTTGEPKGALYSHRSSLLHALAISGPDAFALGVGTVMMPIVPMFHVNAWGSPYLAPMVGSKLVMPGANLTGPALAELIRSEGVTHIAGVPSIMRILADYLASSGLETPSLQRMAVGGTAAPASLIAAFEKRGVAVVHAWGMTETSPVVTTNRVTDAEAGGDFDRRVALTERQGRVLFGCDMKLEGPDGVAVPHDGVSRGDLLVRGGWVASGYFGRDPGEAFADGWFRTGDVATIDPQGRMRIVDRSKDLIKSGGEWISSVDLENIAAGHPAVKQAAVIGVPHPKWDERPLLLVVPADGHQPTAEALLGFLADKVAKWWLPDEVVIVAELPFTATGKVSKLTLRGMYEGHFRDSR